MSLLVMIKLSQSIMLLNSGDISPTNSVSTTIICLFLLGLLLFRSLLLLMKSVVFVAWSLVQKLMLLLLSYPMGRERFGETGVINSGTIYVPIADGCCPSIFISHVLLVWYLQSLRSMKKWYGNNDIILLFYYLAIALVVTIQITKIVSNILWEKYHVLWNYCKTLASFEIL